MPAEFGKKYEYKNDSIEISALKFYIGNINLYYQDEPIVKIEKEYHLVDLQNRASLYIQQHINTSEKFNRLLFNIGVDSLTSVTGLYGSDLDSTNGMYQTRYCHKVFFFST